MFFLLYDTTVDIKEILHFYKITAGDNFQFYNLKKIEQCTKLKENISKDYDDLRMLVITDFQDSKLEDISSYLDNFRDFVKINYLILGVTLEKFDQLKKKLHNFILSRLKDNTSLLFLCGKKNYRGDDLSVEDIKGIVFSFLFLYTQPAFTFKQGRDPFFSLTNMSKKPVDKIYVFAPLFLISLRLITKYNILIDYLNKNDLNVSRIELINYEFPSFEYDSSGEEQIPLEIPKLILKKFIPENFI